jgi:hypothetical protein
MWMGIGHYGVVGLFFFEGNVNGPRYLVMLEHQVLLALRQWYNFDCLVFMQDGASPHWARKVRAFLDLDFPHKWMGRGLQQYPWPARSTDLTPMDNFC